MKKTIIYSFLATSLAFVAAQSVFADGMPYEPVFESEPISEAPATSLGSPANLTSTKTTSSAVSNAVNSLDENKLQNALMQLDSAQVEIRNTLIQYKNEYAEIDNQYKTIQAERKAKKQLVKETEKRIKTIDKTKDKIRKSM